MGNDWIVFEVETVATSADLFEGVDVDRCEGHCRMPPKNQNLFK